MNKHLLHIATSLLVLFGFNLAESGEIKERMDSNVRQIAQLTDDDLNFGSLFDDSYEVTGGKSKWKALGLSILLPGAGQYYVGRTDKMAYFGGAEALVWSGFFGLRVYGNWKREDYKSWAAFHSGADITDKDDLFFEKMTYYDNLDEYNQFERLYEGSRAQPFPDTPEYYWNWDSDESRDHFRDLRNVSKTAFRRSILFLGGAVVNRLIAGIDAYRSAGSYNRNQEFNEKSWKIYCNTSDLFEYEEIEMGINWRF